MNFELIFSKKEKKKKKKKKHPKLSLASRASKVY